MKTKQYILLAIIVFIAFVYRFYQLGMNPPSLTWDEVAWGYNAYALGIDGKDEFGKSFPVSYIESFGDYKPPVYAYFAVLPIKFFGLNEFSTRFPSAFAGVIAVFFTYFLVLRLFPKSPRNIWYALASSLILGISPWHILLSRAAFEANVATTCIIIALWAFLAGIAEKKWLLFVSVVFFVLPFYTFNTPRVFLPLLALPLLVGFWKPLRSRLVYAGVSALFGLALLLPLVPFLLSPQASLRFREVNIFSDPHIVQVSNQEIVNDGNSLLGKFLHNRRFLYTRAFLQHYLDNLSPEFLFFEGDHNPKFSLQSMGELFMWCLPFFYGGWLLLFRKKEGYWWVIPVWFLLGIIPAATARETPHALRIEVILPTVQIVIAYAVVHAGFFFLGHIKKRKIWYLPLTIMCIVMLFELVKFTHTYFVHYPVEYSQEWQYGYKESIAYVSSHQQYYDQVNITDTLGRPYIYYLFYLQIPPQSFRSDSNITRDAFGFVHVNRVGKYVFGTQLDKLVAKGKRNLFIAQADNVPPHMHVLQTFMTVSGQPVLTAYDENGVK